MADPRHLAKLKEGVREWNQWRSQSPNVDVDLSCADLRGTDLRKANLLGANLSMARMGGADLREASLDHADLSGADLGEANLSIADLSWADWGAPGFDKTLRTTDLRGAQLNWANLVNVNLIGANLTGANLNRALCAGANMSRSRLADADLGCANLHSAKLDGASATGIRLWETQRHGWSIKGIDLERAYWDRKGQEPTEYAPGEFERLHSDQTCIELLYQGGVSAFELNTLPALLHHLASLHPDSNIRLKSIEETGGGAKISISVGDADQETTEKIKADAAKVQEVQLALREQEREIERLKIVNEYLEGSRQENLIKAMFAAVKELPALQHPPAPQIVNYGTMTGTAVASGNAHQDFHQTINDNSTLLALLKDIIANRDDLALSWANAAHLESKIQTASAELQKQTPDHSILRESLGFIKGTLQNFVGSLGAAAVATNWPAILTQLTQLSAHFK